MYLFFFSSRRRHTRYWRDWSSDVCSSDLSLEHEVVRERLQPSRLAMRDWPRRHRMQVAPLLRFEEFGTDGDRKSTRLNSSHANISYAVFCLKKKNIYYFNKTDILIEDKIT